MADTVESKLLNKLEEIAAEREQLNAQLADQSIASDPNKSIEIAKQAGRLGRLADPYLQFKKVRQDLEESRQVVADTEQEADFRELAEAEIPELQEQHDKMLDHLKTLLVTDDDAAISSVIVEIRSGTGGDEAALFARDLYEMYLRYCEKKGFKVEVLDQSAADLGGMKEVVLNIKGEGVYRCLGYESGGHRVQRVPETEAQGRIHTSAATVAVLPEPEEINIEIDWDKDVEEHVSRSGGPGGQNVNKVSSAILLKHKETGISVSMRDEKSQHKNRAKARRIMMTRLYDHEMSQRTSERDNMRKTMVGSGDRSQRIRTYNFPQNRVTDHRINVSLHSLEKFMQGEIDELVQALQTYDTEQRLQNL